MSDEPTNLHDPELGAALRNLEVPEHAPGFEARLRDELESNVVPLRRRPRAPRLLGLTLVGSAAAAAALLLVFAGLDAPGTRKLAPAPASAAQVLERIERAYTAAETVEGTLVIRHQEGSVELGGIHTERWTFALRANGDFRLSELPGRGGILYRADEGVELSSDGESNIYGRRSGLAPGPPDQGPTDSFLQLHFGSVLRAFAAAGAVGLRSVRYQGRPAWLLSADASLRLVIGENPTDHIAVTVDRRTGMPVRIVETLRGRFVSEIRIDDIVVDAATDEDFEVRIAPGAAADRSDVGFEHVTPAEAGALVGYEPLLPAWVPADYERAETAAATETDPTAMGRNPVSRGIVSAAYRRGISRFIVTTRLAGPDRGAWSDPLFANENVAAAGRTVTFTGGALQGQTGELVVTPGSVPHVWTVGDRLVVTVSGDLTEAELLRVASSLRG
jgi:hypothetical protein